MFNTKLATAAIAGAAALLLAAAAHAQATNIAVYNFNNTGKASGAAATVPTSADTTATDSSSTLSTNFASANVVYFAGTTVNAQSGAAAGLALAVQGGGTAAPFPNNGDYIQFTLNATDYTGLGLSYAAQRTGTGFTAEQLQYSVNGGATFTNFGAAYAPVLNGFTAGTAGDVNTVNFSSVALLNNNALDEFRIVFTGATSASGNNRLDNIVFTGTKFIPVINPAPTPEAGTMVSSMLGLGLLAGVVVRRRKPSVA